MSRARPARPARTAPADGSGHGGRPARGGRSAEAARNDPLILDAARAVFLADPAAPISAVAAHAGVGIGALYRRYEGKQGLLRALAADGLTRYIAELRAALVVGGDPWAAFEGCLHRVLDSGSQALAQRIAGTFAPTEELAALAAEASELAGALHRRTVQAGALRHDVTPADVTLVLEMVSFVDLPGPERGAELRHRYLALALQALRAPARGELPGAAADEADLAARWRDARTG